MTATTTLTVTATETNTNALRFDGDDDGVTLNAQLSPTSGTWEGWIKKDNWSVTDEDEYLFGNGIYFQSANSLYVSLHAAVGLHFRYGGLEDRDNIYTSSIATESLAANTWHHLAATWNQGADDFTTISLYLDGVQVGTPRTTPLTISLSDELFLGAAQSKDPSIPSFGPGEMG